MTPTETDILSLSLVAMSDYATMFRNNVGALQAPNGAYVRYGLCRGSADTIGWTSVTVTPDMVGSTVAVFTSVEIKTPAGRATKDQLNFHDRVIAARGRAGFARSPEEAVGIVRGEQSA